MPNNNPHRRQDRETPHKNQQSASLSNKTQLQASLYQFRQDLEKAVESKLKDAERKVAGMNSELRAVRRDMERTMNDGKKEIQQNQQMLTIGRTKLQDTLDTNERYYQEKADELMTSLLAKRMENEETEGLPTQECVVCSEEFNEVSMFGCKPVHKQAKNEKNADSSDESSDDSSTDTMDSSDEDESTTVRLESASEDEVHFICANCCKGYAASKVVEGMLVTVELGFPCAEPNCEHVLLWGPISKILDEAILKPLEARLATSALRGIDGIEYCKSCHYGMQIERQEQKFFACQNRDCRAMFCRICQVDYDKHLNKTCDAADTTRKDTIQALEEFLSAAKFRVCPRCSTRFTKDNDNSCNKMTCSCGTTMCYICKESPIAYDHFNKPPKTCQLHSDTDVVDRINLNHAIEEARKDKRFERLLPLLVAKRDNVPKAGNK